MSHVPHECLVLTRLSEVGRGPEGCGGGARGQAVCGGAGEALSGGQGAVEGGEAATGVQQGRGLHGEAPEHRPASAMGNERKGKTKTSRYRLCLERPKSKYKMS